jgi:hypothetical protein
LSGSLNFLFFLEIRFQIDYIISWQEKMVHKEDNMKINHRRVFNFGLIFLVILFWVCLPVFSRAGAGGGGASDQEILIYTFKADPSVKVGYPKGWTVQENQMGVALTEKQGADSAGILIFIGRLQGNVQTKEALAESMINTLRQAGYPDLTVVKQGPHAQAPEILAVDATLTAGGMPFLAHMWCAANTQTGLGIFTVFYAPQQRYGTFAVQNLMSSCLAPMFGGGGTTPAAPPAAKTGTGSGAAVVGSSREIIFIRQEGDNRLLCALDPAAGKTALLYNFGKLPICQPARSLDGKAIVLAVPIMKRVFCITGITRYDRAFDNNINAFPMIFPLQGESYVNSPSLSRDGGLVAVQLKTFQHAGSVNVHDTTTGAYDHTYSAILRRGQLASFKLQNAIQQQALYYQDPEMPEVGTYRRGWCAVFSPTSDIIAFTNAGKLCLHDSKTGQKLQEFALAKPIYEMSALAFSPDGTVIAYIGTVVRSSFGFSDAPGSVVLTDIRSGASKVVNLPPTIRPSSPVETSGSATICLDFSPDSRYIVFSASPRSGEKETAVETFRDLAGKSAKESDLYVLDLQTGNCHRLTNDGKSYDPVWKGR